MRLCQLSINSDPWCPSRPGDSISEESLSTHIILNCNIDNPTLFRHYSLRIETDTWKIMVDVKLSRKFRDYHGYNEGKIRFGQTRVNGVNWT